jgi:hypothetical protein
LRRVVDFEAILLKVTKEVSGTQAVHMRFVALLVWLRGGWCCGCLRPDVIVALPDIAYLLTCGWGSCSELLLPASGFGSVGVLALHTLFVCLSIFRWYIRRDDQDLAI